MRSAMKSTSKTRGKQRRAQSEQAPPFDWEGKGMNWKGATDWDAKFKWCCGAIDIIIGDYRSNTEVHSNIFST